MFALADMESAFASVEQVFRPWLQGRPIVVLSNNDGAVIAANTVAKKHELMPRMCEPYFKVAPLLEKANAAVFSSNYALIHDFSRRFHQILFLNTPKTEPYSVDEAFCDLSGMESIIDYGVFGMNLRNKIKRSIGITSRVGIAETKVLAKAANKYAKREMVFTSSIVEI